MVISTIQGYYIQAISSAYWPLTSARGPWGGGGGGQGSPLPCEELRYTGSGVEY